MPLHKIKAEKNNFPPTFSRNFAMFFLEESTKDNEHLLWGQAGMGTK